MKEEEERKRAEREQEAERERRSVELTDVKQTSVDEAPPTLNDSTQVLCTSSS